MEVATERAQRFRGRTLEVLVEGPNPKNPRQAFGRIRHNKLVYFNGDGNELRSKLVMTHIDECNAFSLFGTMTEVVGNQTSPQGSLPLIHATAAAASVQQQQEPLVVV